MATFNGNVIQSPFHGGWRAVVEYTTSETATGYTVTISYVRACPVDATGKTSLQDASTSHQLSTQNISVAATGQTTTTKTSSPGRSQYPYPSIEWYTHISLYWTFNKAMTWSKGHTAVTKTITVKEVLGNVSLWYSTSASSVSAEKDAPGTSTATLTVTIPALESYTVTLDAQGGTGAPATLTKYYGEALALPQPAKEGYAFSHWTDGTTNYTTSYTANDAASLTAVYSPVISSATITQLYAARDDGSFTWDSQTGTHTSASDDGEYVYIRAWWRVDGADAATISLDAGMADTSTVWTGTTRQVSKPGTGELYIEGVAEWGTTQTALVTGQYDVTVDLSTGAGNPSDTRGTTVSTAFFTMDVLAGGHGVAFGKPATETGLLDVAMALAVASGSGVSPARAVFNVNDAGTTYLTVYDSTGDPACRWYWSYYGNLARQDYTNGAWGTARYYTPSFAPGDSVSMDGYVSTGYISSSRTETTVVIHIPNGMRGVTGAAVTGSVIVRQNNAYLYNSSASTAVNLSGFTKAVTVNAGGGFIRLSFTGSTQTSAVNNSPISVYFSTLTVTFS